MRRLAGVAVLVGLLTSAGCEAHEFEPPDPGVRVGRAEAAFSTELFDTIRWEAEASELTEGNAIYVERCRRCHGAFGEGATDYARERSLSVPSLVDAEWPLAQMDSLRRQIFVGHQTGMPVYGDGNLTLRQIDATAAYILRMLRPDMLGEG